MEQVECEFRVAGRERLLENVRVAPEGVARDLQRCRAPVLDHIRTDRLSQMMQRLGQGIARARLVGLGPERRQQAIPGNGPRALSTVR